MKNTYWPEERLLNLFGENVEHVNCLCGQRQIGARNPLVLSQLGLAALLLFLNVDRDNMQSCGSCSRNMFVLHYWKACQQRLKNKWRVWGGTDPRQLFPLFLILHLLLNFMDTLQGLEALIQQEGCVINQHVDVAHKLFARAVRGQQEKKKKRFSIWKTTFTHLKTNEKKSLRD